MHTPIAIHNLMHGKWRTVVSTGGVALAIILMFMQFGFLTAVLASATQIYGHLIYDVMLRSPDYYHFCDPREFPRSYLYYVASMPEVESVKPLHVTLATWRIPENAKTVEQGTVGNLRGIVALGIDPTANVFDLPEIETQRFLLENPHNLLIDRKTKGNDYGAMDGESFGDSEVQNEVVVEIWDKQFRIVGHYAMGAGLAANGSVVVSSQGYGRFFPGDTVNNVNYGLVQLKPGIDPVDFSRRLNQQLTLDKNSMQPTAPVLARTRHQVEKQESRRWLLGTPIGAIFIAGVVVALVVGTVIVYMVLSNDVANHLREYATLKAMGYTDGFLSSVVMQQALAMALLGYVVSWAIAEVLYRVVGWWANLPMEMSWRIRLLVFVLTTCMCCISGLATVRKLRSADPADLF